MNPLIQFLLCGVAVLACSFSGCRAEAQPSREARQALAVLCPGRVSLAPAFARAAERYELPAALLVAASRNEAHCRPDAVSKSGKDVGLLQVRLETDAARGHTMEDLKRPGLNAMLGARHLAACLLLCGDIGAALGIYSGRKTCKAGRASGYARRVMGFYELATAKEKRS